MGGDFNCHSREWDQDVQHHRTTAILLVETAASLGLEYARPSNYGPTTTDTLSACVKRAVEHQGRSDHIPLSAKIPLRHAVPKVKGRTLKPFSDEEKEFVADIVLDIGDLSGYHPTTAEEVERMTSAIAGAFSTAWKKHSTEYVVGPNSREYWSDDCTRALEEYRREMSTENHKAFRSAVKAAKREFFDKRIKEVATTNKRPWDLMEWVKKRKSPPCKAIQFEGWLCHNLGDLWNTLHSTYNTASDRPVDVSVLEELPDEPERPWPKFSQLELRQALEACSARSAPGPDHIMWRHLKQILALSECGDIIIALANGCMESGHWPRHFKESTSVIIPKPNKPPYSAPKAFRPIVLLNTLGKLIEKMISNRFQHDMIKYNLVDPNQMGGVRQRSTEDAGLFLTHLVRLGWAQKLQTSVVALSTTRLSSIAFDVAQFFPSINHQFLLAVLEKLGFNRRVVAFFGSYLVDQFTTYAWNRDTSDPRRADVGVGQGSALSPVLSALVIAPVMKLFRKRSAGLGCTLISYVDDGNIIIQSAGVDTNCVMLWHAYSIVFELFMKSGLALEHDKTKLFHFTRARTGFDRSLDLGYAPYTGDNPLRPKTYWWYLGFYFDRKLTF
ncbi:hypothetical protein H1R20_g404, partial [Candolleomyces eurysporus]